MKVMESGGKLHWIRNLWLRFKNGGGCCDIYSLDYYLAKKIIKPLKAFRKRGLPSYPSGLNSSKEWEEVIEKMIWSMEYIITGDVEEVTDKKWTIELEIECNKKMQEGLELFGKYFRSLWI